MMERRRWPGEAAQNPWGVLIDTHGNYWRARRVGPGVYEDDAGALHLVLDELLEWGGYPATEENRRMILTVAQEMIAERWPGMRVHTE